MADAYQSAVQTEAKGGEVAGFNPSTGMAYGGVNLNDVTAKPGFWALPNSDQRAIAAQVTPQFGKLPESDQSSILQKLQDKFHANPQAYSGIQNFTDKLNTADQVIKQQVENNPTLKYQFQQNPQSFTQYRNQYLQKYGITQPTSSPQIHDNSPGQIVKDLLGSVGAVAGNAVNAATFGVIDPRQAIANLSQKAGVSPEIYSDPYRTAAISGGGIGAGLMGMGAASAASKLPAAVAAAIPGVMGAAPHAVSLAKGQETAPQAALQALVDAGAMYMPGGKTALGTGIKQAVAQGAASLAGSGVNALTTHRPIDWGQALSEAGQQAMMGGTMGAAFHGASPENTVSTPSVPVQQAPVAPVAHKVLSHGEAREIAQGLHDAQKSGNPDLAMKAEQQLKALKAQFPLYNKGVPIYARDPLMLANQQNAERIAWHYNDIKRQKASPYKADPDAATMKQLIDLGVKYHLQGGAPAERYRATLKRYKPETRNAINGKIKEAIQGNSRPLSNLEGNENTMLGRLGQMTNAELKAEADRMSARRERGKAKVREIEERRKTEAQREKEAQTEKKQQEAEARKAEIEKQKHEAKVAEVPPVLTEDEIDAKVAKLMAHFEAKKAGSLQAEAREVSRGANTDFAKKGLVTPERNQAINSSYREVQNRFSQAKAEYQQKQSAQKAEARQQANEEARASKAAKSAEESQKQIRTTQQKAAAAGHEPTQRQDAMIRLLNRAYEKGESVVIEYEAQGGKSGVGGETGNYRFKRDTVISPPEVNKNGDVHYKVINNEGQIRTRMIHEANSGSRTVSVTRTDEPSQYRLENGQVIENETNQPVEQNTEKGTFSKVTQANIERMRQVLATLDADQHAAVREITEAAHSIGDDVHDRMMDSDLTTEDVRDISDVMDERLDETEKSRLDKDLNC